MDDPIIQYEVMIVLNFKMAKLNTNSQTQPFLKSPIRELQSVLNCRQRRGWHQAINCIFRAWGVLWFERDSTVIL